MSYSLRNRHEQQRLYGKAENRDSRHADLGEESQAASRFDRRDSSRRDSSSGDLLMWSKIHTFWLYALTVTVGVLVFIFHDNGLF